MWSQFVDICKDPEHVARIQKYFGVEISHKKFHNGESQPDKVVRNNISKKRNVNRNKKEDSAKEENQNLRIKNQAALSEPLNFTITNHFWYYLFLFGSELADKSFCTIFFSFWAWNIDSVVGRRAILAVAITLTISKWVKDTVCWPRPASPPAVRIQEKRSEQYGMPSTHATIGFSICFGILRFTMDRYVYSFAIACIMAALWCTLVCISRLYLGMHTVLDIFVGLGLAVFVMVPLVPMVEAIDYYLISTDLAIATLVIISIATVVYYPHGKDCHTARREMALAASFTVGIYVGAWLNHRIGATSNPLLSPPYHITWPSRQMLLHIVLRTILGVLCIFTTLLVFRYLNNLTVFLILTANGKTLGKGKSVENRNVLITKLFYKYVTWFVVGLDVVYLLPNVFKAIGIERPMFYQEL